MGGLLGSLEVAEETDSIDVDIISCHVGEDVGSFGVKVVIHGRPAHSTWCQLLCMCACVCVYKGEW